MEAEKTELLQFYFIPVFSIKEDESISWKIYKANINKS